MFDNGDRTRHMYVGSPGVARAATSHPFDWIARAKKVAPAQLEASPDSLLAGAGHGRLQPAVARMAFGTVTQEADGSGGARLTGQSYALAFLLREGPPGQAELRTFAHHGGAW